MAVIDGRTWLEHLSPPACWHLLSLSAVGRVGVLVDSAPRSTRSTSWSTSRRSCSEPTPVELRGLDRSPSVCFEADGINLDEHTGWSVLVKGRAVEVTSPGDRRKAAGLPLQFWALGEKAHWIRIRPTEVTGHRIQRR